MDEAVGQAPIVVGTVTEQREQQQDPQSFGLHPERAFADDQRNAGDRVRLRGRSGLGEAAATEPAARYGVIDEPVRYLERVRRRAAENAGRDWQAHRRLEVVAELLKRRD